MALDVSPVGDVTVISVHDEEEPIHFSIPSVVPSRYDIPGINAARDAFEGCKFSIPGRNGAKAMKYAFRRTLNNRPYVLIKIVEPNTFIHGTEQQKIDEYGQKLSPDVMRVPVPVRAELIANEIERAHGVMGLKAIRGPVTEEHLNEIERRKIDFLRKSVSQTTQWAVRNPNNVTPQARRRAWALHKMGQLAILPEWAVLDPDAVGQAQKMFNCINCSKLLRKGVIKCDAPGCGVIYDWKRAVENGLVAPSEVPLSKRHEAGLEGEVTKQLGSEDPIEISDSSPLVPDEPSEDLATGLGATSQADLRAQAAQMAREETPVFEEDEEETATVTEENEESE